MNFYLENIESLVQVGITDEERSTPQQLKFSVSFEFTPDQAIVSDSIKDTVDYQIIYDTIKSFTKNDGWNLLESLHHDLLKELKSCCPKANNLKLSIQKNPWKDGSITVR